jgi:hypothetical protein
LRSLPTPTASTYNVVHCDDCNSGFDYEDEEVIDEPKPTDPGWKIQPLEYRGHRLAAGLWHFCTVTKP